MKTLHEMIKDLTEIDVEQDKISDYLEEEVLYLLGVDLSYADLRWVNLTNANLDKVKITKKQLEQLTVTVIEEDE
ncbi:hypothetical protein C6B38_08905 [Spiroplasma sp. ChiS]|uniref:pentapeptide repeat-containing protein n=1 Tax=Spiroplasma sp. ChiS TaxID=2099885 RepID=UPI000CF90C3C|nr:pentapeptide repeat-containing protein [Spiroplasma sp. ChiS]PQP77994.1 hypothetical protein C6B38_08905 [Spiroplasma sp. ChiS]